MSKEKELLELLNYTIETIGFTDYDNLEGKEITYEKTYAYIGERPEILKDMINRPYVGQYSSEGEEHLFLRVYEREFNNNLHNLLCSFIRGEILTKSN